MWASVFVSLDGKGLVSLNGQDLPLVLDTNRTFLNTDQCDEEKKEHAVHPSVLRLTTGFCRSSSKLRQSNHNLTARNVPEIRCAHHLRP